MSPEQFAVISEQLKLLTAAVINNTVKQVEVECVSKIGRQLSAEEKELIHRDCLEEVADIRGVLEAWLDGGGR